MVGGILIAAVVGLIALYIFYFNRNRSTSTEDQFTQAGVSVVYASQSISIKGKTYPVSDIRGLRWVSGKGQHGNVSEAVITVEDMKKPTYKIAFITPGEAEKFVERLSMAIAKAGGPSFD